MHFKQIFCRHCYVVIDTKFMTTPVNHYMKKHLQCIKCYKEVEEITFKRNI